MAHSPRRAAPKTIVVIGPSNIGDAVLVAPGVAQLRAWCPAMHVTLVVGERAIPLFRDDPRIQTLLDAGRYDGAWGRVRLALTLWRAHPDLIVDFRHTLYPWILTPWSAWRHLLRPPRALTHMRERQWWLLHRQVPSILRRGQFSHALNRDPRTVIWWSEQDEAHVKTLMQRWQLDVRGRVVVICPGARSHLKRWTTEGFARVADRLIEDAGAQVVFSGEPDERPIIEEIMSLMRRRASNAVGLTTARQLAALMSRVPLVVTNDSAALHLASAVGTPTVAIFGPTDDAKYGPTAPRSRVIRRRLFCAPCEEAVCRFSHECMRFISPEEVYAAAAVQLLRGETGDDL